MKLGEGLLMRSIFLVASMLLSSVAGEISQGIYKHVTNKLISHTVFVVVSDSAAFLSVFQRLKGQVIKVESDTLSPDNGFFKGRHSRVFLQGDTVRLEHKSKQLKVKFGVLASASQDAFNEAVNRDYYFNTRMAFLKRPGVNSATYDREIRLTGVLDSVKVEPLKFQLLVGDFNDRFLSRGKAKSKP